MLRNYFHGTKQIPVIKSRYNKINYYSKNFLNFKLDTCPWLICGKAEAIRDFGLSVRSCWLIVKTTQKGDHVNVITEIYIWNQYESSVGWG